MLLDSYYRLVEDYPECYYSLGTKYCPSPGERQGRRAKRHD